MGKRFLTNKHNLPVKYGTLKRVSNVWNLFLIFDHANHDRRDILKVVY